MVGALSGVLTRTVIGADEFDQEYGGFGGAPKFPPSLHIRILLRIFRRTGKKKALHMAEVSEDSLSAPMACF